MLLTENAAPNAPASPLPLVDNPTATAISPATAVICDRSSALTVTLPSLPGSSATVTSLSFAIDASVRTSMELIEPEPAPAPATPSPDVPLAALTAPPAVTATMVAFDD